MTMYQIEQAVVEKQNIFNELNDYISSAALDDELHVVEEKIFRIILRMGQTALQEVIARHDQKKIYNPIETSSGEYLPYHSKKSRKYLSVFGKIEIERAYYWKNDCQGVCPLDKKINLPRRRYSYLLENWIQTAIADNTYDDAIGWIEKILGITLSKRGQEDVAKEMSSEFEEFYSKKLDIDQTTEGSVLVGTADCKGVAMVPSERSQIPKKGEKIRRSKGDKKKGLRRDAVCTCDYSFDPQSRTASEMIDLLMRTHDQSKMEKMKEELKERKRLGEKKPREPQNKHIAATMQGKEIAFKDLADRIAQRDQTESKPIYVQIDGEPSLEKGLLKEFGKRGWTHRVVGVCLDIIHVMEYVWEAGTALHGEKNPKRETWVRKQGLALLDGQVGRVIGSLKQTLSKRGKELKKSTNNTFLKVIKYFENHKHMMRYDEFLKKGFPIATGIIEGVCGSLVKDRTDRSGMKWTKVGVQAILNLRAIKRNDDWEEYWDYKLARTKKELYGNFEFQEVA